MTEANNEYIEIAIFPIPGCICFPLSVMPLHIFEPRYRAMIKDCVRLGRRIGVSHTVKKVSSAKPNQTRGEILNSNQDTYQPEKIFSAGFAEIEDITADGRMGVKIMMDARYELVEEIQTLPYNIYRCRIFADKKINDIENIEIENKDLKLKVLQHLQAQLVSSSDDVQELFEPSNWESLNLDDFSFKIFSVVRLEPELMQAVLEMQSAESRLNSLLRVLNQNMVEN